MGTSTPSSSVNASTSNRFLFDFEAFLEGGALDDVFGFSTDFTNTPKFTSNWEITKLSGGLINVTVRATPCRDKLARDSTSVVMKYAPPFVAEVGEGAPFGTFRQVIEYRALSLLGSTPSITSAEAAYGVAIPRVLGFFEDERVLVLQDLGQWMRPLDVWMYPSTTIAAESESSPSLEACTSVGTRLGNLLASIHCDSALLLKSQTLTVDGKLWFENPDTKDLVRDEVVGKILPIIRPWIGPQSGRTERIAKIISLDFDNSFLDILHLSSSPSSGVPRSMFSIGDLWTGSILVGTSLSTPNSCINSTTKVEVGLIDWEFAAPARIGQDIAQLSAWLYLFSTSSGWSSTDRFRRAAADTTVTLPTSNGVACELLHSAAGTLMNTLLKAYARKVKEYPDYAWLVDDDYDQCKFKERLAVIRSIWILFGREVIYNSVEARAKFAGCFTKGGEGDEMKDWQKEMIEVGCWYVFVAGESPDDKFEEALERECVLKGMYTMS